MKIGTRITIARKQYEVKSVRPDGCIILRPAKAGTASDGSVWGLGERCRVVRLSKRELAGEIVGISPIEAKVLTPGRWEGRIVGKRFLRKAKGTK